MTNHSNDFFSRITRIELTAVFSFVKWVMSVSWDETIGNRFVARNKGKFFSFICPSRNTPNRDDTPRQIEIVPIRTRASLSLGTIGDTKCFFFASRNRSSLDQNYLDDHLVRFIWNVYFQWTKNDIFYRIGINFTLCIDYSNFVIDRKQRRSWQREPNETCFHRLVGKLGNIQLLRYCNFINCPVWKRRGTTRDFSFRNSKFMPVHVENRTDDKSSGCEVRAVLLAAFCLRNGIGNCAYINRLGWRLFKNK